MCRLPIALLCALFLLPVQGYAQTLTFSAIPDQDESRLIERFSKVAAYLEERLGVDVDYVPVKSYTAAVTAYRNNQIQLAWFGGLSGVQARRLVPNSVVLAQGIEDRHFKTYIIANTATGLQPGTALSDALVGRTFAFGSRGSTSGRLMPEFYLREFFRQAPEDIFSRIGFSGDHSRTIDLVESGAFELGAVNFEVWKAELDQGLIDTSKVRIIWQTPCYPDYQWTARGDLDAVFGAGFVERLRTAFLDLDDAEILAAFPRSGFVPASAEDYRPIVDTARSIGLID